MKGLVVFALASSEIRPWRCLHVAGITASASPCCSVRTWVSAYFSRPCETLKNRSTGSRVAISVENFSHNNARLIPSVGHLKRTEHTSIFKPGNT